MTSPERMATAWKDPAHEERLRGYYNDGLSCSQIAWRLSKDFPGCSYSRNAVIGKLHRLGLSHRPKPKRPARLAVVRPAKPTPPRQPLQSVVTSVAPATEFSDPTLADRLVRAFAPLPGRTPVGLMDLTPCHCRWPIDGAAGEVMFCGAPKVDGSSYCSTHRGGGVTKFKPTQAKTGNELARQLRKFVA